MTKALNIKQRKIIKQLVKNDGLRYSQLSRHFSPEDKFAYHLKFLVSKNLVRKVDNLYYLTNFGRNTISDFNWDTLQDVQNRPVIFVDVLCKYKNKYWIHKMHTIPFKNWYRLPGVRCESKKNFKLFCLAYMGLGSKYLNLLKFNSTQHKNFYDKNNDFVWDAINIVFSINIDEIGFKLIRNKHKECKWMTKKQIQRLEIVWPEIMIAINHKKDVVSFYEYSIKE